MKKTKIRAVKKTEKRIELELQILNFCRKDFKSLAEFSEHFKLSKNTVRAGYLYPLTKEKRLIKYCLSYKGSTKYKAK